MIKAGMYKGRAIAKSEQWTTSKEENLQLVLDLTLWDPASDSAEPITTNTFLTFTEKSKSFELDRLKALGWQGGIFPTSHLPGIDKNEVDVEVKYETFNGKEKMRVQIYVGNGTFKVSQERSLTEEDLKRYRSLFSGEAAPVRPRF